MTSALAERPVSLAFAREQVDLIKRTIAKDATDDELQLFLAQCQRTGLDPFDRQIYFIKRRQKNKKTGQWEEIGQTQTSIDGFRVVAERTGEMDGQDVAWCDETGAWTDVWLKKTPPFAARVIAYRKGCAHGFPAVARYDEYAQTYSDGNPVSMWAKMPANQLAKCAEALALRKAFPKQLSGLYTREEMGQAENVPQGYAVQPTVAAITPPAPVEGLAHPDYHSVQNHQPAPALPDGSVLIREVKTSPTKNPNVQKAFISLSTGEEVTTIKTPLISLCEQLCQEQIPVTVETKPTKWGMELIAVHRIPIDADTLKADLGEPLDADSIPF